jgi:dipeptidyl-peptidase-3
MGFWNVWDPKLKELGLVGDQEEVAKAMYDAQARAVLTQLRRIPQGTTIEEDHQRDRALIANYIMDKTGAIEQVTGGRNGKVYVHVKDYDKMREGVGMLLKELMRIKAEGDYEAAKALFERYGVHFDPALRDEIVARVDRLRMPSYTGFVQPRLAPVMDANGAIVDVTISYPQDLTTQMLEYSGRLR